MGCLMGRFGPAWDSPAWDKTSPKTWDEWTDVLGHTYRSGDYVAISIINGKSPQMVIGKVMQINRVDSKGMLVMDKETDWVECDEHHPDAKVRGRLPGWWRLVTTWVDSCTVKVRPLLDARGFGRGWNGEPPKAVTYRLWENIIKVDARLYEAKVKAEMAAAAEELTDLSVELTK